MRAAAEAQRRLGPVDTEAPNQVERGAQIVRELVKVWPSKEAPLSVHIAFCEQLQLAIGPWVSVEGSAGRWFAQADKELRQRLKALRQLAAHVTRETDKARQRWQVVAEQAPKEVRQVLRQKK